MRIVSGQTLGGPENYALAEAPTPAPRAGQVLVRVAAVGVGYVDALLAAGLYQVKPPTPFTPGNEFAGVVEQVGEGVSGFKPGDRVMGAVMGGAMAEFLAAPAQALSPVPDGLSLAQAAGYQTNYLTMLHAFADRAALKAGETVLVLGASGGLGLAAIDVAKAMGARVIAAAGTAEKRQYARDRGADEVTDYTASDWREQLKAFGAIDVVADPVGGDALETAFRALAWRGRYLVLGFAAGGAIAALRTNLALIKGASLIGVDVRQFGIFEPERAAAHRETLAQWIGEGKLKPDVGRTFPLEDFRAALAWPLSRSGVGKTVLQIT